MEYLPIALRIAGRPCLVVGGGPVALRKAALLVRAGAEVMVVAPQVVEEFLRLAGTRFIRRAYESSDLEGMLLVVAATDERALNRRVAAHAQERGILVNVVDDPQHCTFVMPSIVDRSPLLVAISTAGAAPVLSRMVRGDIEALLPPGLGAVSESLSRHRQAIKSALPNLAERRQFMEALLAGPMMEFASASDVSRVDAAFLAHLASYVSENAGFVSVVGTGPGDPDQLTFQAQRCMQQAEHVFYEVDVPEAILERCRRDAPRTLLAGGRYGSNADPSRWQDVLCEAQQGHRIAVLVRGEGSRMASELQLVAGPALRMRHTRGLVAECDK